MTWLSQLIVFPLQAGLVPRGSRVAVFQRIYWVFLVLGTLVGVVVIAYMVYNAWKYREGAGHDDEEVARPQLGEIPTGAGGGRKLFLSFGLSTIIVVSLIAWTYGTLLYVETSQAAQGQDSLDVEVVGHQFHWEFVYPNGARVQGTLRVPVGARINLEVTSADVFHNFGIPEQRVKADAIPGQTTSTWFVPEQSGSYAAHCYELCGVGHSYMDAQIVVMEPGAFEAWYANTSAPERTATPTPTPGGESGGDHA